MSLEDVPDWGDPRTPHDLPRTDPAPWSYRDRLVPAPPEPARAPARAAAGPSSIPLLVGVFVLALLGGTLGAGIAYTVESSQATATAPVMTAPAVVVPASDSHVPGSIADIAARSAPSVVQLNVSGDDGSGTGSGFVVTDGGYVVTNYHVVSGGGKHPDIDVVLADGTILPAQVVGSDRSYDLAVVKVERPGLRPLKPASLDGLDVGDAVIAMGSPLGLQGTVTTGIVSSLDRPVAAAADDGASASFINAIQTDAAINPGNSGGPLLDSNGLVVGMNSAIAAIASGEQAGSIGLGFAIPITTVERVATEIIATGAASTPVIGVRLDQQFPGPGARVDTVDQDGPAHAAGLRPGDVITAVASTAIADPTQAIVAIRGARPGQRLVITVDRDGTVVRIPVVLGTAG